jgi:hypothetical protein
MRKPMKVVANRSKSLIGGREMLRRSLGSAILFVGGIALSGCASAGPAPIFRPPPDAGALARAAQAASAVERSYRIVFEWSMLERGARYSGTGVGRIAPPHHAKLDLFLSNAESVASAVLVGDALTVRSDRSARLPSSPLLWGALGVFQPGPAASQVGSSGAETDTLDELRYLGSGSGEELLYFLRGDRIEGMEVFRDGRRIEELKLTYVEGERFPRVAKYRSLDPNDLRELEIVLETVEYVETYPADTFVRP